MYAERLSEASDIREGVFHIAHAVVDFVELGLSNKECVHLMYASFLNGKT